MVLLFETGGKGRAVGRAKEGGVAGGGGDAEVGRRAAEDEGRTLCKTL